MSDDQDEAREPRRMPVLRSRGGRWLGGVCAGLDSISGLRRGWLRLGFVLAGLCGGIGVIVYLACWLIIPTDAGGAPLGAAEEVRDPRGALLGGTAGGLVAVALLAALGATATLFGFGWAVFAVTAVALVALLTQVSAIRRLVGLTLVCALALPAVAVALSPFRLTLQSGTSVARPANASQLIGTTYRSGLGTLMVDLRHTKLPARGTAGLRIDAGVRRTIVALPHDRCVRVIVQYRVHTFPLRLAALLSGHEGPLFSGVVVFGATANPYVRDGGLVRTHTTAPGPTLVIDFSSQGGSLFVRDYPDSIGPQVDPDWPGIPDSPEPRPRVKGLSRKRARYELRAWRRRRSAELAQAARVNALLPGPCGPRSQISTSTGTPQGGTR